MKSEYKRAGHTEELPALMNKFFFDRIIDNLHLAYIVSSTLKQFSVACKSFPALINNASFIFYNPWPMEGLYEVGIRFMKEVDPLPEGNQEAITQVCAKFYDQTMTESALKIKTTQGRACDLLPSLYTAFLQTYKNLLDSKRKEIGASIEKYKNGILKLNDANEQVAIMSKQSEKSNEEVSIKKNLAEAKEAEINIDKKAIAIALEELTGKRKRIESEKIED